MDEAEIQTLKIKINKLIEALNVQIKESNNVISKQDYIIQVQKSNLENYTNCIVIVEDNIKETQTLKNDIMVKKVGINTQRLILIGEIQILNSEIDGLKQEIEKRTSAGAIVWDAFNHIFNPIGAAVTDIIRELTDSLNEKVRKVSSHQSEVDEKMNKVTELDASLKPLDETENNLNKTMDNLKKQESSCNEYLKQAGILKTKAENVKLQCESFVTQAQALLMKCDDGKEVLDYGIDTVTELEKDVRSFFFKNKLCLTL
ncbi:hypothetical protein DICPUDRAFT_154986 [Dictyostelium purpureum]|uniref:Uncharacterized protein n=1 Tax=Dictyostelium purpureum TaxID=5786 RepID=F0ZSS3_DICPU|nr:uncharacterized protein DICPUDRAFT_154986 [Dictyostelium purpureum]EGC33005.1 hypothetical protein DICPUDRAFT_154986 [Dictyostelium purpureum]|eukprot:XP_003290475.1 hypothetical protein DICPUDRAFT_154986 [Dictyostelium purpureum]